MKLTQNELIQVDFNHLELEEWKTCIPAVLILDDTIYKVTTWEELIQIICYEKCGPGQKDLLYAPDPNGQPSILKPRMVYLQPDLIYKHNKQQRGGKQIFEIAATDSLKVGPDFYVACEPTHPSFGRTLGRLAYRNICKVQKLVNVLNIDNIQVYLIDDHDSKYDYYKNLLGAIDSFVSSLLEDKPAKYTVKNGNQVSSMISSYSLSNPEKFFQRVKTGFDNNKVLGDIVVSDEEYEMYLLPYLMQCINNIKRHDSLGEYDSKIFAVALVYYAMNHYTKGTFWPFFDSEYGIPVEGAQQRAVHDVFKSTMTRNKKPYDDERDVSIDSITMHCFVANQCADQFFDFIFGFWRIDIRRDIRYIQGEDSEFFDILWDEIINKDKSSAGIMKHTSMALKNFSDICRPRIKQIIRIIDSCFWDGKDMKISSNRIFNLLRQWIHNPGGAFQNELKLDYRSKGRKGAAGEPCFFRPELKYDAQNGTIRVIFPREYLRECTESEHPAWLIISGGMKISKVEPELRTGMASLFVDDTMADLPFSCQFNQIEFRLASEVREYKKYNIPASPVRLYGSNGHYVDYIKNIIPPGHIIAFTKTNNVPEVLYRNGARHTTQISGGYASTYTVEKGDVMVMPDGKARIVGKKFGEGLVGPGKMTDVMAEDGASERPVWSETPKVLLKTERRNLGGTAVVIMQGSDNSRIMRLNGNSCREFKVDDNVSDVYAYIIDMSQYISEEGAYVVRIAVPGSQARRTYHFIYLKNLTYKFTGTPYVLGDSGQSGTFFIPGDSRIKISDDWKKTQDGSCYRLKFRLDKLERDENNYVRGRDLCLDYEIHGKEACGNVKLSIRIPAFYWKFTVQGEWNSGQPSDLSILKIPQKLYVSGPYDFKKNSLIYVENADGSLFRNSEIYARYDSTAHCYWFNLAQIKSWLDYDTPYVQTYIVLNNRKYSLLKIICQTTVDNVSVSAQGNDTIIGTVKLTGDGSYMVSVNKGGRCIGRNIPVENGQFRLKLHDSELSGEYDITVYETDESDDGFDEPGEMISLKSFKCSIISVHELSEYEVVLHGIKDTNKKLRPLELVEDYAFKNLRLVSDVDSIADNINGLWSVDITDPDARKNLTFYKADLCIDNRGRKNTSYPMLLVFRDECNPYDVAVLRYQSEEYLEPLYDTRARRLIPDEKAVLREIKFAQNKQHIKKERIRALYDDMWDFDISFREKIGD